MPWAWAGRAGGELGIPGGGRVTSYDEFVLAMTCGARRGARASGCSRRVDARVCDHCGVMHAGIAEPCELRWPHTARFVTVRRGENHGQEAGPSKCYSAYMPEKATAIVAAVSVN